MRWLVKKSLTRKPKYKGGVCVVCPCCGRSMEVGTKAMTLPRHDTKNNISSRTWAALEQCPASGASFEITTGDQEAGE